MNRKAIEIMAVSRLKNELAKTGHLIPEIPDNDKSPSWDGEVLAYAGDTDRKDKLIGKIRVQVKGKYSDSPKGSKRSYSLDISDLINFKNNGGAILFVVFLNLNDQQFFCNDLTPEKIKYYLKIHQGKQSKKISVPISPMPLDPAELTDFVVDAISHCRMQTSFADSPIQTVEEFEKRADFESLQLKHFGIRKIDPKVFLLNRESIYWYGKAKGESILVPLGYQEITHSTLSEDVPATIVANGKNYYEKIRRIYTKDQTSCVVGSSLTITRKNNESQTQITITLSDELHQRATDLGFILDSFGAGKFYINGLEFPLTPVNPQISDDTLDQWKADYKWCKEAVDTLKMLHCKEDLCVSKLSNVDVANLNCLIDGIYRHNDQLKLNKEFPDISFMKVGPLHFLLHKVQNMQTELYSIEDFYTSDIQMGISEDEVNFKVTSQYGICTKEVLEKSNNLWLDNMLPDYTKFGYQDHIVSGANDLMLNLISLYDEKGNDEYLNVAEDFSEWLMNSPEQFLDEYIKTINYFQIQIRRRPLSSEEKGQLYSMVEKPEIAPQYKVALYALLGNNDAANHYLNTLTTEQLKQLIDHPIEKFIYPNKGMANPK